MSIFRIKPGRLSLSDIEMAYRSDVDFTLSEDCLTDIDAAQSAVHHIIEAGETVYGINTGFGRLAQKRIPSNELQDLQTNLILSHAAGTGPLLEDAVVRLINWT